MGKPEEIQAAVAELEKAIPAAEEKDESQEIVKSLTNVIDRLTKAGLGSWESAHNGNPLDKSAPMGDGGAAGGYNSTEEQENPDNAAARTARSSKVKTGTPPTPTTLEKGKEDEEEVVINVNQDEDKKDDDDDKDDKDSDDDDKKAPPFAKKSQEAVTEEKLFEALGNNQDFMEVADASDAIQFLTETMAKAIAHISAQTASLSEEVHAELDEIRKSYTGQQEATLTLLKAAKQILEEGKMNKSFASATTKPVATPATGAVVFVGKDAAKDESGNSAQPKSVLVKSIVAAMSDDKLDKHVGTNLLLRLDSQNPGKVWETTPEEIKKVILEAGKTEPKK